MKVSQYWPCLRLKHKKEAVKISVKTVCLKIHPCNRRILCHHFPNIIEYILFPDFPHIVSYHYHLFWHLSLLFSASLRKHAECYGRTAFPVRLYDLGTVPVLVYYLSVCSTHVCHSLRQHDGACTAKQICFIQRNPVCPDLDLIPDRLVLWLYLMILWPQCKYLCIYILIFSYIRQAAPPLL